MEILGGWGIQSALNKAIEYKANSKIRNAQSKHENSPLAEKRLFRESMHAITKAGSENIINGFLVLIGIWGERAANSIGIVQREMNTVPHLNDVFPDIIALGN